MLSLEEFNSMSCLGKSNYLMENFPSSKKSQSFRSLVFGFGRNDSSYITGATINGALVRCPAYVAWKGILTRSFYQKFKDSRPTYADVTCCQDWSSFMSFRAWWVQNQVDGWQLDKDIVGNGKVYSPQNCIFVPSWLNAFVTMRDAGRGGLLIGVSFHKSSGMFSAQCSVSSTKSKKHIGLFHNELDAHAAWKERKLKVADELKPRMDEIDVRIYDGVVRIISEAR